MLTRKLSTKKIVIDDAQKDQSDESNIATTVLEHAKNSRQINFIYGLFDVFPPMVDDGYGAGYQCTHNDHDRWWLMMVDAGWLWLMMVDETLINQVNNG